MNSNLTPAEQWRLHGTFNEETAQELIDAKDLNDRVNRPWVMDTLNEVASCVPGEDFLTPVLTDLAKLVKRTRAGAGKDMLQEIFNDLHAVMERQRSDTDHAGDLVRQLKEALRS